MPTTYTNTQLGGVSVQREEVDQSDAFSANVSLRQSPGERELVFRDGGEFGKHKDVDVANAQIYAVSSDGSKLRELSVTADLEVKQEGLWDPEDYSDLTTVEVSGKRILAGCKNSSDQWGIVWLEKVEPESFSVEQEFFVDPSNTVDEPLSITTNQYIDGSANAVSLAYVGTRADWKIIDLNSDPISQINTFGFTLLADRRDGAVIKGDPQRNFDSLVTAGNQSGGQSITFKSHNITDPTVESEVSGNIPLYGSDGSAAQSLAILDGARNTVIASVNDFGELVYILDDGTDQAQFKARNSIDTPADELYHVHERDGHIIALGDKVLVYDSEGAYDSRPTSVTDLGFVARGGGDLSGVTVAAGDELALLI